MIIMTIPIFSRTIMIIMRKPSYLSYLVRDDEMKLSEVLVPLQRYFACSIHAIMVSC